MATALATLSTIVIWTEDKINFPLKWAVVVVKQLFQYGVLNISLKEEKIFVDLTYTPNTQKLKQKFGTLPVRYMRLKIDNQEEFRVLEQVVKRFNFNLVNDDSTSVPSIQAGVARKQITPPVYPTPSLTYNDLLEDEGQEVEDHEEAGSSRKRQKIVDLQLK